MRLIVENCEAKLSRWLWLEYRHAAEIWGGAIFTNVKSRAMKQKLRKIANVRSESFEKICRAYRTIVLDPNARKELKTCDLSEADAIVIGGILGYEIPKGRTKELVTNKLKGARQRSLGKKQLSIDSAALVAKLVYLGVKLEDIEITDAVEIRISESESVELPYGYVVIKDKAMITPGLIEYLKKSLRQFGERL